MKTRFKSAFHSKTQPLCRHCTRPILQVYEEFACLPEGPPGERVIIGHPRTIEEARKLTNYEIIRFESYAKHARMTVWDGESYNEEFFCGNSCAAAFGRLMAKTGRATQAYFRAARAKLKQGIDA